MSAEGIYKYKLDGKEVGFFCGTYALERTLEAMNATPAELGDLITNKYMFFIRIYMYYAAEYYSTDIQETEFPYPSERIAYKWIDQSGGVNGDFYRGFREAFVRSMGANVSETEDEEAEATEGEEKKS